MAKTFLRQQCINGFLNDIYEDDSVQVLSGPNLNALKGTTNNRGTARLEPVLDPDGDWILSIAVASDPDWKDLGAIKNSGTKNRVYAVLAEDVNGQEIPCGN